MSKIMSRYQCREYRENSLEWSQSRLASFLGVTKNTVSRMERGESDSFELRWKISRLPDVLGNERENNQ